jgi:hypothetical protein
MENISDYGQIKPELDLSIIKQELDEAIVIFDDSSDTRTIDNDALIESNISRADRRVETSENLRTSANNVIAAAVKIVLSEQAIDNEQKFIEDLFKSKFSDEEYLEDGTHIEDFTAAVQIMLHQYRSLRVLSDQINEVLDKEIDDDPIQKHELMKLLAKQYYHNASVSLEEREVLALQGIAAILMADGNANYFKNSESLINQRAFDEFIAHEILEASISEEAPMDSLAEKQVEHFRNLINLVKHTSDLTEPEVVSVLSKREAINLWPEICKTLLQSQKEKLLNQLKFNSSKQLIELKKEMLVLNGSVESFTQAWERYMITVARQFPNINAHRKEKSKRQRIASQRKKVIGRSGKTAVTESLETARSPEVRNLVYIDSNGNEFAPGSQEYQDLISAYLKTHPGMAGLDEDVANILEHLKRLDFSQGPIRGVKKYVNSVKRGESRYENLFALKPTDAVGMSTSSKQAKKIRVLFVLENGSLGILGIVDRDEVTRFEKSLGVTTNAKK